jgi:glycosyltransferase involved in cell wall biosynthesis
MPFNGEPSSRLQFIAAGACYGIFDRLIVHTEQGYARLLSQGVLPDRITRLPVGLSDEPPAANAQPDSMEGPLTFLLFGSIRRYKGLDVLIEAFARLPRDLRASVRLRVVGKAFLDLGPFLELARERGVMEQISIEPGFVAAADVPHLFGPGVVAVFPYREIEASGVLPNAIAGGRPIIASRIGSFGETLEDGVHGMLVPPGDVDALAGAMARLAADREFAARCAARVRELFTIMPSWETIAQRTAEVYTKAITTRCSRRDAAA